MNYAIVVTSNQAIMYTAPLTTLLMYAQSFSIINIYSLDTITLVSHGCSDPLPLSH